MTRAFALKEWWTSKGIAEVFHPWNKPVLFIVLVPTFIISSRKGHRGVIRYILNS